jgi:hypothetical protein
MKTSVRKSTSGSKHKQVRHENIAPLIKKEVQQWAKSIADHNGSEVQAFDCVFCGYKTDRYEKLVRHSESHVTGKLATMFQNLTNTKQDCHPCMSQVVRAIFNHDSTIGKLRTDYLARASALLMKWTSFSASASSTKTLLTHMGRRDHKMRLVFTEEGPEFWICDDARLKKARAFGKHFYTMGFANAFARHLFQHGGKVAPAMRSQRAEWTRRGCDVCSLSNIQSETMCALAVDIMESAALKTHNLQMKVQLGARGEFRSLSADATYKMAVKVEGQTSNQSHNYVTAVGLHGCPIGIEPGMGESPEAFQKAIGKIVPPKLRKLVQHMALDTTNKKLHYFMTQLLSNLGGLSLDTIHPCMTADKHMMNRKLRATLIGLVLRSIMGKFGFSDKARAKESYYTGKEPLAQSSEESKYHNHILAGDVPKKEAKRILKTMDPNIAMKSREEFVKLVAALVVIYPHKLDVKRGAKTTLRNTMAAICTPERAEWYMNNIRFRSRLTPTENTFLGTGSCRNEQVHSTLNTNYAQTVRISKRMLNAQLQMWLGAEMAVFLRAMESKTTISVRRSDLRQVVIDGIQLFTAPLWKTHLESRATTWVSGPKAQKCTNKHRKGVSNDQEEIYKAIRAKTLPVKRGSVYVARAQKRLRCK